MFATQPFLAALVISLFLAGCATSADIRTEKSFDNSNSGVTNPVVANPLVGIHRHDETLVLQVEGAASGESLDRLSTPQLTPAWQLGEPDLIVTLRAPYSLPLQDSDVFRNFVIPNVTASDRYVRALEFRSGNHKVVHHAEFRLDESDASWQRDTEEPEVGFGGMDNPTARYPDGHFVNWVPGKRISELTEGHAWRLPAKADLVVQLHMMPSGFEEVIDPQIGLYFTDEPPKQNPQMIWLGSRWLPIAAGDTDFMIRDSYELPHDVDVLSVLPHCHFICKGIKAWAMLPDGSQQWLARVEDWDFYRQSESRFKQPLSLPRGTTVSVEFSYDNSADNERNPNSPPQDIEFGPLSSNEMADLWIQVMPKKESESEILKRFSARHLRERIIERQERIVEIDPENTVVLESLAIALTDLGRLDEALNHWRRWVQLAPNDSRAHLNLGTALGFSNQVAAAASHLKRSTELDPGFAPAFFRLGRAQSYLGRFDDALLSFRAALALSPNEYMVLHATARLLASHPEQDKRRADEALEMANRALEQLAKPDAMSLSTLAMAQAAAGGFELAATTARLALNSVSPDDRPLDLIIKRQVDNYEQGEIEVMRAAGVKQFVAPNQRHAVRRGK
jgi:tetratricopeptide (TPR) repeat protein